MITAILVIVALIFLAVIWLVVMISGISGDMMDRIMEQEDKEIGEVSRFARNDSFARNDTFARNDNSI